MMPLSSETSISSLILDQRFNSIVEASYTKNSGRITPKSSPNHQFEPKNNPLHYLIFWLIEPINLEFCTQNTIGAF